MNKKWLKQRGSNEKSVWKGYDSEKNLLMLSTLLTQISKSRMRIWRWRIDRKEKVCLFQSVQSRTPSTSIHIDKKNRLQTQPQKQLVKISSAWSFWWDTSYFVIINCHGLVSTDSSWLTTLSLPLPNIFTRQKHIRSNLHFARHIVRDWSSTGHDHSGRPPGQQYESLSKD